MKNEGPSQTTEADLEYMRGWCDHPHIPCDPSKSADYVRGWIARETAQRQKPKFEDQPHAK